MNILWFEVSSMGPNEIESQSTFQFGTKSSSLCSGMASITVYVISLEVCEQQVEVELLSRSHIPL